MDLWACGFRVEFIESKHPMALGSSTQATDRELTQCLSGVSPASNPNGGNRLGMRRGTEKQSVAKKFTDDAEEYVVT